MAANTPDIHLYAPRSWQELSRRDLRFVYRLIAASLPTETVMVLSMLRFTGLKLIGRQRPGRFLMRKGRRIFSVSTEQLASLMPRFEWLAAPAKYPVRLPRLRLRKALPADLQGVSFETYIILDNLYQGFIHTRNEDLLDQISAVLYPGLRRFSPLSRVNALYWMISLKDWFASRYPDFFAPVGSADGNLLGRSTPSVEEMMNAQIRALTKGDPTKESVVLSLDTHRALTELNAQAREYKELKSKIKS